MSHSRLADGRTSDSGAAYGTELSRPSRRGWRGRSREWSAVAGLLRAAEESRGGVLLVEGQSGMGKSLLLGEAVDAANERGFMSVQGAADEVSRLAPLVPLMSALGESPHSLLAAEKVARSDAFDLRLWLVAQVQARLEERAARGRLLITLDDLHWADPTTLLALRSLIPELSSYPLVWILCRTCGGGGDADRLFEVLEDAGATRIVLDGLDEPAVVEIVADVVEAVPEPGLVALAADAGGNPFMLTELLGGLVDEGAVEVVDGRARLVSERVPQRVQEIVRGRLNRLSPRARHLLQVGAVLGRSFSVDDLAAMLGEPADRLLPGLEEAEAAGAVVTGTDTLMFRHDLIWRTVNETIAVPVRQTLHREAGELLLKRGGSAIDAATHLMPYSRPGDSHALAGLDRAVQEVLSSSPQTAADLALRVLELSAPLDPRRFDRTATAVHALTTAGRLPEAADLASAALGATALPEQAARLRYELAYVLYLAGRPGAAAAEAEAVLRHDGLRDELRGLAEDVLLRALLMSHEHRRGRERAEAVVADRGRDRYPGLVGAHMLLAYAVWQEGRAADTIAHLGEAVRFADSGPVRYHRGHPRLPLAIFLMCLGRFDEAETVLQAAADEIAEFGHTAYAANPLLFRAVLRLAEGRLDDATAEAEAGLAMAEEMGARAFTLPAIVVRIIVAVRRGDLDAVTRQVEHYTAQNKAGQGLMLLRAWGDWAMALVADARGDPRKAMAVLEAPYTDLGERCWLLMTEPSAAAWLTRIALAVAERGRAELIVAAAERLAHDNPEFGGLGASAAHAHGIFHEDSAALAKAAETYPGPWNRASAAEDLGRLFARADGASSRDAAIRGLDQALEGYEGSGALRDAARVRARLRELGVRRRHWSQADRPLSGWASLTDTERTVAVLVAQGLTNPQVARQMFISPHTVKFHLSQVFRKLGIGSRVELARLAMERAGKATPPRA